MTTSYAPALTPPLVISRSAVASSAAHGGEELVDVVGDEVQPAGLPAGLLDRGDEQREFDS